MTINGDTTASGCDQWFSVGQIAEELNVSRMAIYRLVNNGSLAAFKIGQTYRVQGRDLREYLATHKIGFDRERQKRFTFGINPPIQSDGGE